MSMYIDTSVYLSKLLLAKLPPTPPSCSPGQREGARLSDRSSISVGTFLSHCPFLDPSGTQGGMGLC